jgi:hypothetical protein
MTVTNVDDNDALREANRLARAVLDGQMRNYTMMRSLLHLLLLLVITTGALLVVLLVQVFR